MHGVGQQINVMKLQSISCKIILVLANACLAACEGTICLSVLTTVTVIENLALHIPHYKYYQDSFTES